ncbi:MAG: DUF87 domain-containing protein [Polyangiales bacterium]
MTAVQTTSEFLLPELHAIGDSVTQMFKVGAPEELMSGPVRKKLQGMIDQGRITLEDSAQLAIYCDAVCVAEEAIFADGQASDREVAYAVPLLRAAAGKLSLFRAFYRHAAKHDNPDSLREFMSTHRTDAQLFGGACEVTRWLGLSILQRLAANGVREPLDRYADAMIRLAEDIVVLESDKHPADVVREKLEQRLNLRGRLQQAKDSVSELTDPRVTAFCSVHAPEVFHAIAHAQHVHRPDPLDVDSVHASARAAFSRLVDRAAQQDAAGAGRMLLVLGAAGSGKTHLMRAFRERVHGSRSGYVGYLQLSAPSDDYPRLMAASLVGSLERPFHEPEVPASSLMCLSDALLATASKLRPEQRRALLEAELSDDDVCKLVFELADLVVSDPRLGTVDIDVIRALLFLQRRETRVHARIIKYLRCEPLGQRDLALIGELTPRAQSDGALHMIAQLGRLVQCLEGGALVVLLDQLEDLYLMEGAKGRFQRLMAAVLHVISHVPNAVVVVACLRDFYAEMKPHLSGPMVDRLERDPEPQQLTVSRSLAEIEAVLRVRLDHLYESQGVRVRSDDPLFPWSSESLLPLAQQSMREVLNVWLKHQHACVQAGRLVELPVGSGSVAPVPSAPPTAAGLTTLWEQARADLSTVEVPEDDAAQLALLAASIRSRGLELAPHVTLTVKPAADELLVELVEQSGTASKLLWRITNKSPKGGGLTKQLKELLAAAKKQHRTPVALRGSEFGSGKGQLPEQLAELARVQGRREIVDDTTWRTLVAYQKFCHVHEKRADLLAWQQADKPLGDVELLSRVLPVNTPPVVSTKPPSGRPSAPQPPLPMPMPPPPMAANSQGRLRIGRVTSVQPQVVELELQELKRHAAFLGSSGSGKTNLALNVIEQSIEQGRAVVLIDRKGDLAVYADPAVWDKTDPDPMRARRKRELLARADVRLFTPGNPRGRPLRLRVVPEGLGQLPTHERAQIAGFCAQGLARMMHYKGGAKEQTHVAVLGRCIDVLARMSDGEVGLSELVALIVNQDPTLLAELGHLDTALFGKLVDQLETLRLSHGLLFSPDAAPLRAELLLGREGVPAGKTPITIVSTKFLGGDEQVDFWLSQLLIELGRWASRSPAPDLQALLFLDEADAYLPAIGKPATKEPLLHLLKRARSAGLGVLLATQSPGDFDYKARDNIATWWVGRITSKTAIEKVKPILADWRGDLANTLGTFTVGEFFQSANGKTVRIRADRALMDTAQLNEDEILALAAPTPQKTKAAG